MINKREWKRMIGMLLAFAMVLQMDMPMVANAAISDGDADIDEPYCIEEPYTYGETYMEETDAMEADEIRSVESFGPEKAADVTDGDTGTVGIKGGISWAYDEATKTLTVSGGDEIYKKAEEGKEEEQNLFISPFSDVCRKKTVEKIVFVDCTLSGDAAGLFSNLHQLKELDLSGLNTKAVTNMRNLFYGCRNLTTVDLSKFDTAAVTDMSSMFYGCRNLKTVDLSKLDTAAVTDMSSMFSGCSVLSGMNISMLNTGAVKSMKNMFANCKALADLNVSGINTGAVTNMEGMFSDCGALKSLDVSKFNTAAVTNMSAMFSGCAELTGLDVSKFSTGAVTDMGYMFYGCRGLKALDVSSFNTATVTRMSNMFAGCSGLTDLDLRSFNTGAVTDMGSMFYNCNNLKNLAISSFRTEKVTKMEAMFKNCTVLEYLDLSSLNTAAVTNMQEMFAGCASMETLDLSGFRTTAVKDISNLFSGCGSLIQLDLSSFDIGRVTKMDGMFTNCGALSVIVTPQKIGNLKTAFPAVFYDDSNNAYTEMSSENENRRLVIIRPSKIYIVRFNGNGAESGAMYDQYFEIGVPQAISAYKFARKGYSFSGWNTKPDGTGKSYTNRANVKNIIADAGGSVTLYAQWTAHRYNVKFDGNGGSGSMTTLRKRQSGSSFNLPANKYKKDNCVFAGWDILGEDGSVIQHFQNKASVMLFPDDSDKTITFYARWVEGGYSITYNLKDGINNAANPDCYSRQSDAITLADPTRTGYRFGGWYSDAKLTKKARGISQGSKGNKTFYAKWTANKYSVKFDGNGSTGGAMSSMKNRVYGKKYVLSANKFRKTGYVFSGWNTEEDGSGMAYKNQAQVQNLSADHNGSVTLYAQWEPVKYVITYKLGGGKNENGNPARYHMGTATIILENPTRTGYSFVGWYKDVKFNNPVTTIDQGSTGKKTLYAKWKAKEYSVRFDGNGATEGSMDVLTGCVYGTKYSLPANTYKRSDYTFAGWNTVADGKGKAYKNKASVKGLPIAEDGTITLYAQWKKKGK